MFVYTALYCLYSGNDQPKMSKEEREQPVDEREEKEEEGDDDDEPDDWLAAL